MLNRTVRKLTRLSFNLKKHHLTCSYCVTTNTERAAYDVRPLKIDILDFFQKKLHDDTGSGAATTILTNEPHGRSEKHQRGTVIEQYLKMYNVTARLSSPNKYKDMLQDLNTLVRKLPRTIIVLPCYAEAIDALCNGLAEGKLDKKEILQVLYYVALKKKNVSKVIEYLIAAIRPLEELSIFEMCIVADSCFKTGTKLEPQDVRHFESILENNIEELLQDIRLLVSVCKIIRCSKPSPNLDLDEIGMHIANYPKAFDIGSATHILQLYAEMYHCDKHGVKRLVGDIIKNYAQYNNLSETEQRSLTSRFATNMRKFKYLDGFHWSLYRLAYQLEEEEYNVVFRYMDTVYSALWNHPIILLRIAVCLWALGIRLEKTVKQLFENPKALKKINDHSWKTLARLQLLRSCVEIEAPYLNIKYYISKEVDINPQTPKSIKIVHKIMLMISKRLNLHDIRIDCPIKGISILGISFRHSTKGKIHIDMLSETSCLRGTNDPHGILRLKIRLIKVLGYHSLLIQENRLLEPVSAFVHVEDCIVQAMNDI